MYLAGDIGGTKTNLALQDGSRNPIQSFSSFPSKQHPNLESIIEKYLLTLDKKITHACFAVAGVIKEGICHTTNLPWVIDAKKISQQFSIPCVYLINDLESNAYAIDVLENNELQILQKGSLATGNRAVISPGTGLGEAGIYWDGKKYHPFASEGGHCDFGPANEEQLHLCHYLHKRFGHASCERVISGPGIKTLFDFLTESEKRAPEFDLHEFDQADPSKVISSHALDSSCSVCTKTLQLFTELLGGESGNLALKLLARGGIFIGGGICPKILPYMKQNIFLKSFTNKGRFSSLLQTIPVTVILDDNASLKGALYFCKLKDEKAR